MHNMTNGWEGNICFRERENSLPVCDARNSQTTRMEENEANSGKAIESQHWVVKNGWDRRRNARKEWNLRNDSIFCSCLGNKPSGTGERWGSTSCGKHHSPMVDSLWGCKSGCRFVDCIYLESGTLIARDVGPEHIHQNVRIPLKLLRSRVLVSGLGDESWWFGESGIWWICRCLLVAQFIVLWWHFQCAFTTAEKHAIPKCHGLNLLAHFLCIIVESQAFYYRTRSSGWRERIGLAKNSTLALCN